MAREEDKPVEKVKKVKVKKGKKPHKNKPTSKKYEHYKVERSKAIRTMSCPRCGVSVFLAQHEGRAHCGKCNYTEFRKK